MDGERHTRSPGRCGGGGGGLRPLGRKAGAVSTAVWRGASGAELYTVVCGDQREPSGAPPDVSSIIVSLPSFAGRLLQ